MSGGLKPNKIFMINFAKPDCETAAIAAQRLRRAEIDIKTLN